MNGIVRERGTTLVEATVALALLALLSVGILSAFRLAERGYRQLVRVDHASRDIVIAQRFLRGMLESAYPFKPARGERQGNFGLEGALDRLAVTAPMPISSGTAGSRRFEILLRTQSIGPKSLIVRSHLDENGADGPAREEVLIERVESAQWSYLEPVDAAGMQMPLEPQWLDSWLATHKPPRLVRLRVSFPPNDPRVWPELIVDPRITDDADCEFDVVAQACREAQS